MKPQSVKGGTVTIRLLFVDEGEYRTQDIRVSSEAVGRYERLIDLLQEEPEVLMATYIDLARLCSAQVVSD